MLPRDHRALKTAVPAVEAGEGVEELGGLAEAAREEENLGAGNEEGLGETEEGDE